MAKLTEWGNAVLVHEPIKKKLEGPVVLVKRKVPDIAGPNNEQVMYLPGEPTISLFTGAGGMDLGLEAAGFCTVVQHEWTAYACQTLIANRPRYFSYAALIQGDIRETPTSMLLEAAGLRVGEAGIVSGGPPCQGFSTANTHAGKRRYDQRNDLVFEFLRVVREAQPRFFIFENVPGFTSFNKNEYIKAFLAAAYDCYYEIVYGLLDAVEYGVPQRRCRFICMGTRRDLVEIDGLLAGMPNPQCFSPEDLSIIKAVDSPLFSQEYSRRTRTPVVEGVSL